jgi:hypothetical protein
MARISTYALDTTPSLTDLWIGTDSATQQTKNFSVDSIVNLLNDNSLIDQFDGVIYEYKTLDAETQPSGILNLSGQNSLPTEASAVTTVYLSKVSGSDDDVTQYIQAFDQHYIKINQQGNLNIYGVYQVNSITNHDSNFLLLQVNFIEGNGTFIPLQRFFVSNYQSIIDKDFSDDSVTEFGDVTSAGSGQIITNQERTNYNEIHTNGLRHSDVIDNLVSSGSDVPLSANQGLILKGYIDTINTLLLSDNIDLDSLQEVVDFIELNRETLETLTISSIAGLQDALDTKVDKITGKQLSEEDFTTVLKSKLDGIESEAEVNVQADWAESISTDDSFIQNKPTDVTDLTIHQATELNDINSSGSGYIITNDERSRIEDDLVEKTQTVTVTGTQSEVTVSPNTPQALDSDISFNIGLPDDVSIASDLNVGDNVVVGGSVTATGDVTGDDLVAQNLIKINNAQTTDPTLDNGIYIKQHGLHEEMHFRYHNHDLSLATITEELSSGILQGGELSRANGTQFTIQAGKGIVVNLNKNSANEPHPDVTYVEWDTQTIDVFNLDALDIHQLNSWIYIDDSGIIQQQSNPFTDQQYKNSITIGSAIHSEGVLNFVKTFPKTAYGNSDQFSSFIRMFGPIKRSGHKITANGINLSLDRASGVSFALGRNYSANPNAPSDIIDGAKSIAKIHRYYSDGSGDFVLDDGPTGQGYTVLDPTKFDNGSGTLANMPNNKYSIQRVYFFPSTPDILVVYYGTDYYDNKEVAEKSIFLEEFTEAKNTAEQAIHVATIVIKKEADDLSASTDSHIYQAGLFRNLSASFSGGVDVNAGINDLSDVSISSPQEGQSLTYNAVDGVWTNAAGGGGDSAKEATYHLVGLSDMYYAQNL